MGVGTLVSFVCNALGYNMSSLNPLVSYLLPMIPAIAYIFFCNRNSVEAVPFEKAGFGTLGGLVAYPLFAVAMLALGFVTEPLSSWLPMPDSIKAVFEKILNDSFWAFITTVIAAPVMEEFILRGIMQRGLLKHTTPLKAILWSAFFFAVIHLNPWQAIGAFIAGIFLGWVYWRTHSLIACIFIHAVNNGTAYFLQLANPHLPADSTYKDFLNQYSDNLYCTVFVIFAVLLALILHFLNKKLPKGNFGKQTDTL
jgi:membrane protease YdiL (CAAX protease family)